MARKPTTKNIAPNGEERTVPVEKVQEIAEQAAQEQQPQEGQIQVNVDFAQLRFISQCLATAAC